MATRAKSTTRKQAAAEGEAAGPPRAIDEVLTSLERVVAELEGGELPLETALERFEAGVRLAREGGRLLDRIEERVEVLLEGRDEAAPFRDPNPTPELTDEERDDDDV